MKATSLILAIYGIKSDPKFKIEGINVTNKIEKGKKFGNKENGGDPFPKVKKFLYLKLKNEKDEIIEKFLKENEKVDF